MERTEGAHPGEKRSSEAVIGSPDDAAASQRRRAQSGVAAEGRCGRRVALARERAARDAAAVTKEVERAMKQGTALVQASLDHLAEAERSWDKWVESNSVVIDGYPTEKQVVSRWEEVCVKSGRASSLGAARGSGEASGKRLSWKSFFNLCASSRCAGCHVHGGAVARAGTYVPCTAWQRRAQRAAEERRAVRTPRRADMSEGDMREG